MRCFLVIRLFLKFFGGCKCYCGDTGTPVLDFWWCLLWVSKPEWAALFVLGRVVCLRHSLRFTSGVKPAALFAASMVAKPTSSTYLQPGIDGAWILDLLCHRQTLYRLSYVGSASSNKTWPWPDQGINCLRSKGIITDCQIWSGPQWATQIEMEQVPWNRL